jgi:hypothetical protein
VREVKSEAAIDLCRVFNGRHRLLALAGACLALTLLLAGCGGSKPPVATTQNVSFGSVSFTAPVSWRLSRSPDSAAASDGAIDRVEVLQLTLEKPYRAALFAATARELNRDIARLALELSGRIESATTVRLAGGRVRSYRLAFGHDELQEIAFVLRAQTEYELLCRRLTSDPNAPCLELFRSFAMR